MKNDRIADIFTLSPIQQGMLFHILADADSAMYYEQEVCRLSGEVDLPAFRGAWEALVARHEMLRTFFAWRDLPHPVQIVETEIELPLALADLRGAGEPEREAEILRYLLEDSANAARIDEAPLFRLKLFRTGERDQVFVLSIHHLIHDAWSFAVLLDEFTELYAAQAEKREPHLGPSENYKNYVAWLKKQDFGDGIAFWRNALEDFPERTPLPVRKNVANLSRKKNPSIETADVFGKEERFLSIETSARLARMARVEKITPNVIFQSLWAILSARLTGREKAVFGATVAGRPVSLENVETIVGNFINTLPLGVGVEPGETLAALWKKLQAHQAWASLFEFVPLAQIAAACGRKAGEEMFESILVYQNFARSFEDKRAGNLRFESFRTFGHPNYPLTLRVTPGARFFIEFIYDERVCAPDGVAETAEMLLELSDFVAGGDDELCVGDVLRHAEYVSKEKRKAETANKRSRFAEKLSAVKAVSAKTEKN